MVIRVGGARGCGWKVIRVGRTRVCGVRVVRVGGARGCGLRIVPEIDVPSVGYLVLEWNGDLWLTHRCSILRLRLWWKWVWLLPWKLDTFSLSLLLSCLTFDPWLDNLYLVTMVTRGVGRRQRAMERVHH